MLFVDLVPVDGLTDDHSLLTSVIARDDIIRCIRGRSLSDIDVRVRKHGDPVIVFIGLGKLLVSSQYCLGGRRRLRLCLRFGLNLGHRLCLRLGFRFRLHYRSFRLNDDHRFRNCS